MRRHQRNRVLAGVFLLSIALSSFNVVKMKTITFTSADGLEVTADEYIIAEEFPYILLFHEQQSSRGEFQSIARRLNKFDYNCLAVDLRNGGNSGYISNETAKRCRERRCAKGVYDISLDMEAAIAYAYNQSNQQVILLGSGANGSLSLKIANENKAVKAAIAFSPGEYFIPNLSIEDTIASLKKPVFITSSLSEVPYVTQLTSGVDEQFVTLFEPKLGEGGRGTTSLTVDIQNNSEYWLALMIFFKELL